MMESRNKDQLGCLSAGFKSWVEWFLLMKVSKREVGRCSDPLSLSHLSLSLSLSSHFYLTLLPSPVTPAFFLLPISLSLSPSPHFYLTLLTLHLAYLPPLSDSISYPSLSLSLSLSSHISLLTLSLTPPLSISRSPPFCLYLNISLPLQRSYEMKVCRFCSGLQIFFVLFLLAFLHWSSGLGGIRIYAPSEAPTTGNMERKSWGWKNIYFDCRILHF